MKFAKLVDKAWEDKTAAEILAAPPSALEGLTEKHDEVLKGFGIKTVADLGNWKYAGPRGRPGGVRRPRQVAPTGRVSGTPRGCRTLDLLGTALLRCAPSVG